MVKRQTLVLLLILSFLIPISFTQKCDDTDCATDDSIDINKYMCFKLDDTTGCKWTLKCEEGKDSCSDLALNDTSKYNCVTKDPKNTQFRKCEVELKKCNEIPSSDNEIYCSYFPVSDDKAMTHGCIMTQNLDGKYFCKEELLCDTIKKSNEIIDCSKYAVSDDFVFKCVEHNNSDVYACKEIPKYDCSNVPQIPSYSIANCKYFSGSGNGCINNEGGDTMCISDDFCKGQSTVNCKYLPTLDNLKKYCYTSGTDKCNEQIYNCEDVPYPSKVDCSEFPQKKILDVLIYQLMEKLNV